MKPGVRSDAPVSPTDEHAADRKRQRVAETNGGDIGSKPAKQSRTTSSSASGGSDNGYSKITSCSGSTVSDDTDSKDNPPAPVVQKSRVCWHCSNAWGDNPRYHVTKSGERVQICKGCYQWKLHSGENDLTLRRCVLCGRTKKVIYNSHQKCQDCVAKPTQACWHCDILAERLHLRAHVSPDGTKVQVCKGCYQWKLNSGRDSLDLRHCMGCGNHKNVVYDSHQRCQDCRQKRTRTMKIESPKPATPLEPKVARAENAPAVPRKEPKESKVLPTENTPASPREEPKEPKPPRTKSKAAPLRGPKNNLPSDSGSRTCWHCDASLVSPSGHSMLRNHVTKDGRDVHICKGCSEWLRNNKMTDLAGRCCATCGGHKNVLYDRNLRCQNCREDQSCWHCAIPFAGLNGCAVRKTHFLEDGSKVLICVKCDYWKKKHESVDLSRRCCVVCGAHKRVVYDHLNRCYECRDAEVGE